MDYTQILQELNQASLFDLHRLRVAISQELENPQRIAQIKAVLNIGLTISYFDPQTNSLIEAVILEINRTRCFVRNVHDQKKWTLPFHFLNISNVDTDIHAAKNTRGIPKNVLKIGDKVGFKDKNNQELFGEVIRLNQKTATIKVNERSEWRVPYGCLFPVFDGETGDINDPLFIPYKAK